VPDLNQSQVMCVGMTHWYVTPPLTYLWDIDDISEIYVVIYVATTITYNRTAGLLIIWFFFLFCKTQQTLLHKNPHRKQKITNAFYFGGEIARLIFFCYKHTSHAMMRALKTGMAAGVHLSHVRPSSFSRFSPLFFLFFLLYTDPELDH
jgi:hypothetical protein